jgi:hypothetical protein
MFIIHLGINNGKRPRGVPKREWGDDIKTDFKFSDYIFMPSMIDNLHDTFRNPVTGYDKHENETSRLRIGRAEKLSNPWHKQGEMSVEFVVSRFNVFVIPLL